jgi:hypothetical protein
MKPSDKVIGRLYALYQTGLSLEQVGKKHGTTRQNIHKLFKKRGLQRRSKRAAGPVTAGENLVRRVRRSPILGIAASLHCGGTTGAPCLTTRMKPLA